MHETSVRVLEEVAGTRPVGFRAPCWEWTTRTPGFLRRFGFLYDSSLMDDDRPYRRESGLAAGICELPVDWSLDDWRLFEERSLPPSDVRETWQSEFDAVLDLDVGYFMLTMHPECIGRASRIRMLEQLVRHMHAQEGVAFVRCDELVRFLQESEGSAHGARSPSR